MMISSLRYRKSEELRKTIIALPYDVECEMGGTRFRGTAGRAIQQAQPTFRYGAR